MSDQVAMTVWFRGEVRPAEEGWHLVVIQEGPDHQPIAELDLGVWPLTIEAALVMAEEAAQQEAEYWRRAARLAVDELTKEQT